MPKQIKTDDDEFSPEESQSRFDAALKGALKTPHKPLKEKDSKKPGKMAGLKEK